MNKFIIIPVLALALLLGASSVMAEEGNDEPTSDASLRSPMRPLPPEDRREIREERREDFRGEDGERHPFFERRRALLLLEGCGKRIGELRDRIHNFVSLTEEEKEVKREVLEARRAHWEEYHEALEKGTSTSTDEGDVARLRQYASECRKSIVQNVGEFAGDRIEAIARQMEQFVGKLQARLDLLEESGTDVSNYEAQLNNIQSKIDTVQALATEISTALTESEPDMASVKIMLRDAHTLLKETREMLRALLEDIKGDHTN